MYFLSPRLLYFKIKIMLSGQGNGQTRGKRLY